MRCHGCISNLCLLLVLGRRGVDERLINTVRLSKNRFDLWLIGHRLVKSHDVRMTFSSGLVKYHRESTLEDRDHGDI